MAKSLTQQLRKLTTRQHLRVVAFVVLGMSVGAFLMLQYQTIWYEAGIWNGPIGLDDETETVGANAYTLEEAEPITLTIPKLNITAPFETPLGVHEDGSIEVPNEYDTVGWYKYGPTPGELGPAVVLGHVDSVDGPAVLWSLGQLEKEDRIFIDRADGSAAEFRVTRLERHLQDGFPTEEVYGNIDHAGLRLITCSGTYDHSELRYTHNLIVFAELVEPNSETTKDPENTS